MTKRTIISALLIVCGLIAGCDDPWGTMCQAEIDYYQPLCAKDGPGSDACAWIDEHATAAGTCH